MANPFYFVYNNENLDETNPFMSGQDIAFATKNVANDRANHYMVCTRGSVGHSTTLTMNYTPMDPRDELKGTRVGDFRMFELTSLPSSMVESILMQCVSREGWPENVLTEIESRGFLNEGQKERAVANRKSSANVPYNQISN